MVRGGGTWSIPPGWNGWQRNSRRIARRRPRTGAVHRDRGQRVLAARRVEPTPRRQRRTYPPTVRADRRRQEHGQRRVVGGGTDSGRRSRSHLPRSPSRRRSPPSGRCPAARTTGRPRRAAPVPPGQYPRAAPASAPAPDGAVAVAPCYGPRPSRRPWERQNRPWVGWRSLRSAARRLGERRRAIRIGTGMARWTTRTPRPARRPPRIAAENSLRRRSRWSAASTMHARPRRSGRRRSRPLARRAERMARPARVRMRSRKPWVFARRRLFGW